ncbi:hypothetical protein [Sphingopyxis terrae]
MVASILLQAQGARPRLATPQDRHRLSYACGRPAQAMFTRPV